MTLDRSARGYTLLKLIRKYLELDIYGSLDVHTEETLEDFEQTLMDFHARLQVTQSIFSQQLITDASQEYIEITKDDEDQKSWDGIIKVHSHIHAIRDIRTKGVLRNMDTKPSEKFNGPLRKWYLMQTNFRNVESQVGLVILYVLIR